jgi:D-alanyl-D-alanine carboxypeptidase
MAPTKRACTAAGRSRVTVAAAVVVGVSLIGLLVERSSATSGDHAAAVPTVTAGATPLPSAPSNSGSDSVAPGLPDRLPRNQQGGLGEADGLVPAGVTVFDDGYPAVAKLDATLLGALRRAATDAARARVTLYVDSGWRSPEYQEHLLRDAIGTYGSEAEAARWVATPDTSPHVSGDAVDIGQSDATAWLSKFGAKYGLCQIYRNEPWHYELRPGVAANGCPAMFADAAHDPRMQR